MIILVLMVRLVQEVSRVIKEFDFGVYPAELQAIDR